MKKNIANKWIAALRSGKYKQGTDYLKDDEGNYCCLGVLCEITKKESGFVNYLQMKNALGDINSTLPIEIKQFTGMDSTSGSFFYKEKEIRLSALNDEGKDFNKIANIIEKHWKIL